MKNNKGCLPLLILLLVVGFFIKVCNNRKESNKVTVNPNYIDTIALPIKDTIKDVSLKTKKKSKKKKNIPISESYSSYSTPIYKKKTSRKFSTSVGCGSTQCRGMTKKGSRCGNMTTNCSGYCWRHS